MPLRSGSHRPRPHDPATAPLAIHGPDPPRGLPPPASAPDCAGPKSDRPADSPTRGRLGPRPRAVVAPRAGSSRTLRSPRQQRPARTNASSQANRYACNLCPPTSSNRLRARGPLQAGRPDRRPAFGWECRVPPQPAEARGARPRPRGPMFQPRRHAPTVAPLQPLDRQGVLDADGSARPTGPRRTAATPSAPRRPGGTARRTPPPQLSASASIASTTAPVTSVTE